MPLRHLHLAYLLQASYNLPRSALCFSGTTNKTG